MLERKTDDRQADYQNDVKNHGARCKMKKFYSFPERLSV